MAGLEFTASAWTELRAVLEAARWTVFVDGDGTLRVEPYPFDVDPDVTAVWGCAPGEAMAVDVQLAHDITQLRNIVDASRAQLPHEAFIENFRLGLRAKAVADPGRRSSRSRRPSKRVTSGSIRRTTARSSVSSFRSSPRSGARIW
jgi:hypothetical protein